jgi:hypothetical protein
MTARLLKFPRRGPFPVRVVREDQIWLVICRDHGWLHARLADAIDDAADIAEGFAVHVNLPKPVIKRST